MAETASSWHTIVFYLAWVVVITGVGAAVVWASLVAGGSWEQQWPALFSYALLFITGQGVAGGLLSLWVYHAGDYQPYFIALGLQALIFLTAVPAARRNFKCSWFAAGFLAVCCGLLAWCAWPWRY